MTRNQHCTLAEVRPIQSLTASPEGNWSEGGKEERSKSSRNLHKVTPSLSFPCPWDPSSIPTPTHYFAPEISLLQTSTDVSPNPCQEPFSNTKGQ